MASPAKIAPRLPETLPEDFSEWDGEASSATKSAHSRGLEAVPAIMETSRSPETSKGRETIQAHPANRTGAPVSSSPSISKVDTEFEALLQNQQLISELVDKLHSRPSPTTEAETPTIDSYLTPTQLNIATVCSRTCNCANCEARARSVPLPVLCSRTRLE